MGLNLDGHLVDGAWHVAQSLQLKLVGKVAILGALDHLEVVLGICIHLIQVSHRVQFLLGVRVVGSDMTSTVPCEATVRTC